MQQLKATIARDLVQGQGEHSPTKELLKQYVPLEGIITTPVLGETSRGARVPVENTMAPRATEAPHATVARRASNKMMMII